jgi:hypothetical protein
MASRYRISARKNRYGFFGGYNWDVSLNGKSVRSGWTQGDRKDALRLARLARKDHKKKHPA